jgi:hypothetical protein
MISLYQEHYTNRGLSLGPLLDTLAYGFSEQALMKLTPKALQLDSFNSLAKP